MVLTLRLHRLRGERKALRRDSDAVPGTEEECKMGWNWWQNVKNKELLIRYAI